jgi:hypothetical protein
VGRWLVAVHPDVRTPAEWTRELAAAYVAAVDRATVGQWARAAQFSANRVGQPLKAQAKHAQLGAIRTLFTDAQEWGWISRRFDPRRCSVRSQLMTNPRVIAEDIWSKLLWAGLNVTADNLPAGNWREGDKRLRNRKRSSLYPLEMVRAVTVVWLFAGLRSDEIRRLRVGCIRWQYDGSHVSTGETPPSKAAVCWLDVP